MDEEDLKGGDEMYERMQVHNLRPWIRKIQAGGEIIWMERCNGCCINHLEERDLHIRKNGIISSLSHRAQREAIHHHLTAAHESKTTDTEYAMLIFNSSCSPTISLR